MKRYLSIVVLVALLMSFCCIPAFADEERDSSVIREYMNNSFIQRSNNSVEDWYYVDSVYPENHTYSYIYDQPSDMKGKNLGRVDDGESVYVYYLSYSGNWTYAYCKYTTNTGRTIKGYVHFENLTTDYRPTDGWYCIDSITPSNCNYSYIYDQPSDINGDNLGRVDDGECVYFYYVSDNGKWAYCAYEDVGRTIKGYIHYENLVPGGSPPDFDGEEEDPWVSGWYYVDSIYPENHTYSYIYDQPSDINGNNLGRVNDGESVYVYSLSYTGKWAYAYCKYTTKTGKTIKGYVHYENLRKY